MRLIEKLLGIKRAEQQLDQELQFHLEQRIAANEAKGMTPAEARRHAAIEFGGVEGIKEECREVRRFSWLEESSRELSYAFRQLRKSPVFAVTAILTVALGIGACTALFSIVNGVLLRPLPFPDDRQIVVITESRGTERQMPVAPAAYLDWARQSTAFSAIAALDGRNYTAMIDGKPVGMRAQAVTANFFTVTGVQPMLGRGFRPEEATVGHDHVVILNYYVWKNRFGRRPDIINQTVLLNGEPYVIVGVLPSQDLVWNPQLFTPKSFSAPQQSDYGSHGLYCVARLKDGVSLKQAQSDLDRVSADIARAHPDSNNESGAVARPLMSVLLGDAENQLVILLCGVGILFLVASVNLVGLLIARASARYRELSVRVALGASRARIVRQFLWESLLVTLVGGALGAYLSYLSMGGLVRFARTYVPRTEHVAVDGTVLAVTAGLMLLTGVVAGIFPALQAMRTDVIEALKGSGRSSTDGKGRSRLRRSLVALQIGFALILLMGAGVLARSFFALQHADQGFTTENVQIGYLPIAGSRAYATTEKKIALLDQVMERFAGLPDIQAVAFASEVPMIGGRGLLFALEGAAPAPVAKLPSGNSVVIAGNYFAALGIPLKAGRLFGASETPHSPRVVIINEELARNYFPGRDPVGQRLMIYTMANEPEAYREIVGVVGNTRTNGPQSPINPQFYEAFAQHPEDGMVSIVRGRVGSAVKASLLKETMQSLDRNLDFQTAEPYAQILASAWSRQKFCTILFSGFAAAALLLSSIGIYGIMAYSVERRRHEFGIRLAIGADRRDIARLVLSNCGQIILVGAVIGLAGTFVFGRIIRSLLFAVTPADPLTLVAALVVLATIAALACWIPARRAMKTDPAVALRTD